jgi:hypothetical protein
MRLPQAALVLVLDRSGSMNMHVAGARATQQQVANEAAALAIESLRAESLVGVVVFEATVARPRLFVNGVLLGSFSFSTLGLIFGSIPTCNPGDVQMPSTLLRWELLFISGVFVPLSEMGAAARAVACISPLTYAQDLMNHAVLGTGLLHPWVDYRYRWPAAFCSCCLPYGCTTGAGNWGIDRTT